MFWLLWLIAGVNSAPIDGIPDFVTTHAPLLRLYSADTYFPSDIEAQIANTKAFVNGQQIETTTLSLDNLDTLNAYGSDVYLTSNEGILALPQWFQGERLANGISRGKTGAVILVDKPGIGPGITDVFYFYFYAYNQGNYVNILGNNIGAFGNHVGDWEHVMVRFQDGSPKDVWLSQHADGQAFTYEAVEKDGKRPIIYVGNGTHANWAVDGPHEHTIPGLSLPYNGLLTDWTDAGSFYDSIPTSYFYRYDGQKFTSFDAGPVNWLNYQGKWGDAQLPDDNPSQTVLFGNRRYTSGPTGPIAKDLMRADVCPTKKDRPCIIRPIRLP